MNKVYLMFLSLVIVQAQLCAQEASSLITQWESAIQEEATSVQHIAPADLRDVQALFETTLLEAREKSSLRRYEALNRRWNLFGFRLDEIISANETLWLIRKEDTLAAGQGVYLFRLGTLEEKARVFLQAPHSITDEGTGKIVFDLFMFGKFRLAAWNSTPRNAICGEQCSDLAHRTDSAFHALTKAFASIERHSSILQFHGFEKMKRRTDQGRTAEMILSSGSTTPSNLAKEMSARLTELFPAAAIRLFGSDNERLQIEELGATKNVQMRELERFPSARFLHIELSREFRENLLYESDVAATFFTGVGSLSFD